MEQERFGDWMQTYSGRQFWPLDPRLSEIHIEDIAHALSNMCRYAGHVVRFYSVAEHCCLLVDAIEAPYRRWALLHDASEAYLVDVPRPVKPYLHGYHDAERSVMTAVCFAYDLPLDMPARVKEFDDRILCDEKAQAMASGLPWRLDQRGPIGVTLNFWSPPEAEAQFLQRFRALWPDR